MRRTMVVLVVAAALTLAGAGVAAAAASSTVSIGFNTSSMHFHGTVDSSNSECEAGRIVKVFKRTSSGRVLEGRTLTESDRTWKVDVMHAHGHYFALAPTQKVMHVTCDGDRSRTIDVM